MVISPSAIPIRALDALLDTTVSEECSVFAMQVATLLAMRRFVRYVKAVPTLNKVVPPAVSRAVVDLTASMESCYLVPRDRTVSKETNELAVQVAIL